MDRQTGPREMWHEACRAGMVHTAYGILLDMFHLWELVESDPASPATEHQIAGFKEDLMHILDDSDGEQLRLWRHLWHNDRDAFEERAHRRVRSCVTNPPSK